MSDDRKPLNPLERQENTGVVDGTSAPMAEGRQSLEGVTDLRVSQSWRDDRPARRTVRR